MGDDLLSKWYDAGCDVIFPNQPKDTTISGESRKIGQNNVWLMILLAFLGGIFLAWRHERKTVIACIITAIVFLIIGHFFWPM